MHCSEITLLYLAVKRFPFDWHNPIGYSAAYIFEYIGFGYEYVIIACMLAFGIASFLLAMSVTKEIRRILLSINDKTQKNELRTAFLDFIGAHSAIKQLSIIFDQK